MQKEFDFALNFCCNDSFTPELHSLSALDRYFIYSELYNVNVHTNIKKLARTTSIFFETSTQESLNEMKRMDNSNKKYRAIKGSKPLTEKPILPKSLITSLQKAPVSITLRYQHNSFYEYLLEELYALIQLNVRVKNVPGVENISLQREITQLNIVTELQRAKNIPAKDLLLCKKE